MPKTNIYNNKPANFTNTTFELVKWPLYPSDALDDKVLALQTTRFPLQQTKALALNDQVSAAPPFEIKTLVSEESPFNSFNLGLHVGDNAERVIANRNELKHFISQQLSTNSALPNKKLVAELKIQWLEQVHGNKVVTVTSVDEQPMIADASITRQKNIALAIMTADCLPILLSHRAGIEIAAIHGGWRPLVANIIAKTIEGMRSKPADIVAWLGPCIGKDAFEVGGDVKQAFTQQDQTFNNAFLKQENGKYLADLQQIARRQLESLGVTVIANLEECTYHTTEKYYSYRKEQITGRMASVICRR
ncbi:peptidoglycan editing factor PgeF [Colwellia sp. 12G3]|uniref:peptidoglycan editing factor PgeF n=1 Tax=Colwellia sp. 12G3 TaxID=2058299 RepID=UPI000C343312|nr:peptidoglycan editing factor PgeF [Colwellia sp. 12G3]PKI12585.1 peptidoglycan editing factor PgeF [Colwellia sp. 12G3]